MNLTSKKVARLGKIVHHVPGRIRIKFKDLANNSAFFNDIKKAISSLSGVDSVRISRQSSSIVVHYKALDSAFHIRLKEDPSLKNWLEFDDITTLDTEKNKFTDLNSPYAEQHSRLAESIVSVAEQLDSGLLQASNGYLDFKVLLPIAIAVASSLHKAKGRGTPMWISLSTFAFNSFLTFHHRRIDTPRVKIISILPRSR